MFSIDKLLVPVAFSDNCRGAARHAGALACRFKSEIVLLHVLEPLGAALEFASGVEEMETRRREWFAHELEAFFRAELFRMPVTRVLLEGDPAGVIVKVANEEKVGLIAMPTHGYGPFRRLLMGSVTAKVLHDAACPVWTGVHLERALIPEHVNFGTVACAVDLGPQTAAALRWAADMAEAWSSKLVVVHAVSTCPDMATRNLRAASARDRLETYTAGYDIRPEIHIDFGDPPAAIRHAVEALEPDLLVIGRGHKGIRAGRLPSTAYAVLRESPCPVVSV